MREENQYLFCKKIIQLKIKKFWQEKRVNVSLQIFCF